MGAHPVYAEAANGLGEEIARRGITLVFGGSELGLMGMVANGALRAGGRVIGVIPQALFDKEIQHPAVSELHVVKDMHTRKALMAELADGFVAMPGGLGTFEELCEVLTWTQLGFHYKPCALLNTRQFYAPLLAQLAHASEQGFIKSQHAGMLLIHEEPATLLDAMFAYTPIHTEKWIKK